MNKFIEIELRTDHPDKVTVNIDDISAVERGVDPDYDHFEDQYGPEVLVKVIMKDGRTYESSDSYNTLTARILLAQS